MKIVKRFRQTDRILGYYKSKSKYGYVRKFSETGKESERGFIKHTDPYTLKDLFSLLVRIYIYTV